MKCLFPESKWRQTSYSSAGCSWCVHNSTRRNDFALYFSAYDLTLHYVVYKSNIILIWDYSVGRCSLVHILMLCTTINWTFAHEYYIIRTERYEEAPWVSRNYKTLMKKKKKLLLFKFTSLIVMNTMRVRK